MSANPATGVLREKFLPYYAPYIGPEEIDEVVDSLRSGWISTGPKVKRFEREFAAYVGADYAVAVNSGTAALHLSLAALGVGAGDEVILPTLTFCATANVVVHLGATPVLVDVDDDMLIDLDVAERAITSRTKAIVPVHYAGQSCDLDAVSHLARRLGLFVVEDASHAAGSTYRGVKVGTHGDAVAFSFDVTKNLTAGEGGMITTHDGELASRLRCLSMHGLAADERRLPTEQGSWNCEVSEPGYKANMTDLQAALGIHQLRRLDWFIERRREMARRYEEGLGDLVELHLPRELPGRRHAWHAYSIRLNLDMLDIGRGEFVNQLSAARIGASVPFIPVHLHPFYAGAFHYRPGRCPRAERTAERLVSLPLYPRMSSADLEAVIKAVRTIVAAHRTSQPYRDRY